MGDDQVRVDPCLQVFQVGLDGLGLFRKNASRNDITSIFALAAVDRNSDAELRASCSRFPAPLSTHQSTSSRRPRAIMLSSEAPAPISMSSEWAPR